MANNEEILFGAVSANQVVKFAFGQGESKFASAANVSDGTLAFVANTDGKGGAIYAGGTLVSSRVLDYAITGNAGAEQTVAVTYLNSSNTVEIVSCKVVDASYVEAQINALDQAIDSSLAEIIESIEDVKEIAEAQSYKIVSVTPSSENVLEEYQLQVSGSAVSDSSNIKIYKDSALKSVELVDEKPAEGETPAQSGQFLKFTYLTVDGAEKIVYLNVSEFLVENEFGNGLEVSTSGVVAIQLDENNEDEFLTVGEGGLKLSGVQDAIDTAAASSKSEIAQKTEGFVTVSSTTGSNGQTVYTIEESDIASANTLSQVSEKANANESAIATLNGDESTAGSVKNAVKVAQDALQANIDKKVDASVYNAKIAELEAADASNLEAAEDYADGLKQSIDAYTVNGQAISTNPVLGAENIEYKAASGETAAVSVSGAISALEEAIGQGGSVESQIDAKIAELDKTIGSQTVEDGKHIAIELVQTDGALDTITIVEKDIASAALLGTAADASNLETAFGKIAKAQETANSAQTDLDALEGVVGEKANLSEIEATTVWGALEEIAAGASADVTKIETHLNSDYITATADQAISVTPTAVENDYKEFAVSLNIATGEKVLSQTADGLKSTISLTHDSANKLIKLTGINDEVLASIDTTDFVVDGLLTDASYNQTTGELTLTFNDGKDPIVIDMVELMDIEDIVIANDSTDYLSSSVAADTSVATIGVKLGDFAGENQVNGLASTSAVKTYVDAQILAANNSVTEVSTKLANYISTNDSSISEIKEDISALDASVLANSQSIDAIKTDYVKVSDYNTYVSNTSTKLNDIDSSIDNLQSAVESIQTDYVKVSDYNTYISNTSTKLGEIDSSIDNLQLKDEEIDSSIGVLKAKDVEIDSSISAIKEEQTTQNTSINNALTALTWTVLA